MSSLAASRPEGAARATAETWEARVRSWCHFCENVDQLTHMVRGARDLQELAAAIDVIREAKNPGVAMEVVKGL